MKKELDINYEDKKTGQLVSAIWDKEEKVWLVTYIDHRHITEEQFKKQFICIDQSTRNYKGERK